jgi:primosomal protein N' (replication factor Y) (superfamily II helicase)
MNPRFCEVALPVPLRTTFTYAIPERLVDAEIIGARVVVPFRNRAMAGVALKFAPHPPTQKNTKEIVELVDAIPALTPELLALGEWISRYYVAPIGETLRSMLPPLAELREHREYALTEHGREFYSLMKERGAAEAGEAADLETLELLEFANGAVSAAKLKRFAGSEAAVERLVRHRIVAARERMERKSERVQKIVAWNEAAAAENAKEEEAREILTAVRGPLPVAMLMKEGVSRATLSRLEKAGKVKLWDEPFTPDEDPWEANFVPPANVLNAEQKSAIASVREWLASGKFTAGLLHGITGSGKTEVYLGAMEAALAQGRTAIVLVPEIALTLWLSRLVRARFGATVAVLHSGLGDKERSHEWWRVRRGEARVVVGTRSAVFAPLENVGLIIVDEEQETSYKQEETPRYNGRDAAMVRASLMNAVALLGSATPSLESFQNARTGKYKLLELATRVADRPLASVKLVDLRQEFKQSHRSAPASAALVTAICKRFDEGTQALVLINRRGYSWYVVCRSCGAGIECRNCSIALSYHKRRARLECHYCGYSSTVPKLCPKCKSQYLYFVGDGAERVDEFLREQFPKARIGRLDRDTVRTKREFACRHANGRQGTRLRARHACWCSRGGSRSGPPRFSRRGTYLPAADPSRWPRGPRAFARRSAHRNVLPRALRDSARRRSGLQSIFRARSSFPQSHALSAVHCARQRAGARPQNRKRDSLVASDRRVARFAQAQRAESAGTGRGRAFQVAQRLPLSDFAEVAEPPLAGASLGRMPRVLQRQDNSRERRDCRRRSRELAIALWAQDGDGNRREAKQKNNQRDNGPRAARCVKRRP